MVLINDTSRHRWRFISILTFPFSNANRARRLLFYNYSRRYLYKGRLVFQFIRYRSCGPNYFRVQNARNVLVGRGAAVVCHGQRYALPVIVASPSRRPTPDRPVPPTSGRRQHRFYGVRADRYHV